MNLSCFQFSSLINTYTLAYICNNYDVYCDDYCMTDTSNKCYCYCDNDNIYCYEHNYFLQRFFSVLFFGLLFACICYCIFISICNCCNNNYIKQNTKNDEILPKYDEINKI